MRGSVFTQRTLPYVQSTPLRGSPCCLSLRLFSSTSRRATEPAISDNSLRKTLEAHRSQNRDNLIRKVASGPPPEADARPEDAALGSKEPPQPVVSFLPRSPRSTINRDTHTLPLGRKDSLPTKTWEWQVQWAVDTKRGRFEQSPWMAHVEPDDAQRDGLSRLDAEVRALDKYLSPTDQEHSKVMQIVRSVKFNLKNLVPFTPQLVGPWGTGLAMGHSGLEFILPMPDPARSSDRVRKPSASRPQARRNYARRLRRLSYALRWKRPIFCNYLPIFGKETPFLLAEHRGTSHRLQFRFAEGPPASVEYIRDYLAEYPALRPLYMTIRLFLESRGLFGHTNSSITFEALVVLLVSFLKQNHGRFRSSGSLGEQLLEFLRFYGCTVDLATTGISVDPPGCFDASTVKKASEEYPDGLPASIRGQQALMKVKQTAASRNNPVLARRICIQDPANYMYDLGRNCLHTLDLQRAFADAYSSLTAALDKPDSLGESLLASAVRVNFDDMREVRARIGLPFASDGSTAIPLVPTSSNDPQTSTPVEQGS